MSTPAIPTFGKLRLKDCEFKASLDYRVRLSQKKKKIFFSLNKETGQEKEGGEEKAGGCAGFQVSCVSWGTMFFAGSDLGVLEEGGEQPPTGP